MDPIKLHYPIYIISKGRYDLNYTAKTLEYMNVPYTLVVEPHEFVKYASEINSRNILVTPFKNLGQGSIPVRNFVMGHAIGKGHAMHWILDDNIKYFYRLHNNMKIPLNNGACFLAIEDFINRYENVGMVGMQYDYLAPRKQKMNPFIPNTRIYSCILINHKINMQWRGRYNEDSDLSLRVLKAGWCTALFNVFLCGKMPTMMNKGGNYTELYSKDTSRREFAESLKKQHPEHVEVIWKYNRWHHKIDFTPFKQMEMKFKKGIKRPTGPNNYGLKLIKLKQHNPLFK